MYWDASLYVFPFIGPPFWLVGPSSLDVSRHLSPFIVSLHLSPALSIGIWLSGCLLRAFSCLSSCVSRRVSPNLSVSTLICLHRSALVVSGSFACSPLCVFHHVSLTFHHVSSLVLHLSPKPFVSNHMSALVAVSCSSFIMTLFVFCACLCSLLPL